MPETKRALPTLGAAVASTALLLAGVAPHSAHAEASCPDGFAAVGSDGTSIICERIFTPGPQQTWTIPAGVASIDVLIVGGGGAGSDADKGGGGGGGGGAWVWINALNVVPGDTAFIESGAGGASGGLSGGNSYFERPDGIRVTATGGDGAPAPGSIAGRPGEEGAVGGGGGRVDPNPPPGANGRNWGANGGTGGNFVGSTSPGQPGNSGFGGDRVTAGLFNLNQWQVGGAGAGGAGGGNDSRDGGGASFGGGAAGGSSGVNGATTAAPSASNRIAGGGGGGGGGSLNGGAAGTGGAGQSGVVVIRTRAITATTASAPTSLVATAGNGQVSVAFTAPSSDGGAPITNYEFSVNSGVTWTPRSPTSTSSPITITGLTNGTAYRIELRAVNSVGAGTAAATGFVTPVGPPGAPVSVSATPGDGQALVSWSSPLNTGGSPITGYTVTSSPGGFTCSPATVSTTSCTVTGLSNGTSYTFTVVAANSLGSGSASAPSGAVTPASSTTVPGAPTGVTGVAGDRQVTVSWTPPASDGGSPITGYTVTSSPGGLTCSAALTSCTVTGLTNGTDYTFTVSATNAIGTGVASSASNLVRPRGSSPNSGTSTDAEPRPAGGEADRRVVVVDEAVLDNLDRSVPTGQASVVVGGTASATVAATVDGADAVSVGGAGWSVQVARSPSTANTRPAGSPLLITAGGEVRITATGFSPGSSLLVALQPTGALLGTVSVDAQGRVDGVVSVPSDSLVGDSTLQVAGILPGLQVAGVAIGLLVERSTVLASRQAAKVVMIGARTDTARLSKRGQRKVRTQLGLIDQAASNVERVIVTAYPTKAEARAEEKAASRARARSTTALISDAVLPQTPVTRTRVGSITQHPDRSGKVMLTVVYRE